ncbi:sulfite exporter TauE/SafE family protein [Nocardioides insulae]|uniref:sulfite exporter TauE/SafE family protein n=1 Tax=Nocardioides insulae TaxID=394734 RepID=UPI00048CC300|nr:sulfite exporter TauE/SafE family protein [Nocardioides insulae]
MTPVDLVVMFLAGIGAGLTGSVAGLASLISYPALLAIGLDPLDANVTNTVALFGLTAGSILGSRPELRGQGHRLPGLIALSVSGGIIGAALLLAAPAEAFEAVVPWLVALGAVLILCRDRIKAFAQSHSAGEPGPGSSWAWGLVIFVVGIYGGYFGAGVGVIALAVMMIRYHDSLPVVNAVKNVSTGAANAVAAAIYIVIAPVHWPVAVALGIGALIGGTLGPRLLRVLPERPTRYAVAAAGLFLAVHLATA